MPARSIPTARSSFSASAMIIASWSPASAASMSSKGQTVGRHEPLGRMPNLSDKKALLYMELRKGEDTGQSGDDRSSLPTGRRAFYETK